MGGKSGSIEVTDYYMATQLGICLGPVDAIKEIRIGEKTAWSGSVTSSGTIKIHKPDLFGGSEKEGGVSGSISFTMGGALESVNSNLAAKAGVSEDSLPAYRGISTAYFHEYNSASTGFLWATNYAVIKDLAFRVRRVPKPPGLSSNYRAIGVDANPAAIIMECLTSQEFGMWAPLTNIDVTSFATAAQTLLDEGFGLSFQWVNQEVIEEFINIVLSHIGAVLYVSPSTGLVTVKLIRGDYDVETLRTVGPSDARLTSFKRRSWGETINEVVVKWRNPQNETEETVAVQDAANIATQGSLISQTMDMPGIRSRELALRVAQRELQANVSPLLSVVLEAKRELSNLTPGAVFKLNWPRHGIDSVVMRVTQVDYGSMGSDRVIIEAKEDIYGMPASSFFTGSPSAWVDPREEPSQPFAETGFTLPYYLLANYLPESVLAGSEYPSVVSAALVAQDGFDTYGYDLWAETLDNQGQVVKKSVGQRSLAGYALLDGAINMEVTSAIKLKSILQSPRFGEGAFLWVGKTPTDDGEWMVITGSSTGSLIVRRGCLDTVPRAWPDGTPVWLVGEVGVAFDGTDPGEPIERVVGEAVSYWALTKTSLGILPMSGASEIAFNTNDRPYRPYRPSNVRINGLLFPTALLDSDMTITWSHRNRDIEVGEVLAWDASSSTKPDGVTYTVEIYNYLTDQLITSESGITGNSFVWTANDEETATGTFVRETRVVVYAVDAMGESWQKFEIEFTRPLPSAWGFNWGNLWGN